MTKICICRSRGAPVACGEPVINNSNFCELCARCTCPRDAPHNLLPVEPATDSGEPYMSDKPILVSARRSILMKAEEAVNGPRRAEYGHPSVNFDRICILWNAWFRVRPTEGDLTHEDHAAMMILLKLARLAETPDHLDSLVDVAGYAATWEMLIEGKLS